MFLRHDQRAAPGPRASLAVADLERALAHQRERVARAGEALGGVLPGDGRADRGERTLGPGGRPLDLRPPPGRVRVGHHGAVELLDAGGDRARAEARGHPPRVAGIQRDHGQRARQRPRRLVRRRSHHGGVGWRRLDQ